MENTAEGSEVFSLKLSWSASVVVEGFALDAYIGPNAIGKSHGTYEQGKQFRLTKIDVYDPYKKQGYGTIMIYALIGAAKTKKCTTFIFEGVSDTNNRAINLYKRLGAQASSQKLCNDKTDYEMSL